MLPHQINTDGQTLTPKESAFNPKVCSTPIQQKLATQRASSVEIAFLPFCQKRRSPPEGPKKVQINRIEPTVEINRPKSLTITQSQSGPRMKTIRNSVVSQTKSKASVVLKKTKPVEEKTSEFKRPGKRQKQGKTAKAVVEKQMSSCNAAKRKTLAAIFDDDEEQVEKQVEQVEKQMSSCNAARRKTLAAIFDDDEEQEPKSVDGEQPAREVQEVTEPGTSGDQESVRDDSFDDVICDPKDRGCTAYNLRKRRYCLPWWIQNGSRKSLVCSTASTNIYKKRV